MPAPRPAPLLAVAAMITCLAVAAGCSGGLGRAERTSSGAPAVVGTASTAPLSPSPTPQRRLGVGVRSITTARGDRRLPVTIWYPAAGAATDRPRRNAKPAAGRHPVVVFSHGLNGTPADFQPLLRRWAAAGFVVAAPSYPHTSRGAASFNVLDVVNQPADASQVLTALLALDTSGDDPLRGHLDRARIAAAGHSAGAITTVGLFTADRDSRLRAGVVLAGNALGVGTDFTGPAAPLLFVHGDRDPLVSYASGRAVFASVTWPKAFLTLPGQDHSGPYLDANDPAFAAVETATTDFLRWSLYGDPAGLRALHQAAGDGSLGPLDDQL